MASAVLYAIVDVVGVPTRDAIVSLAVFVAMGSVPVAALVAYSLVGGARSRSALDELKAWLGLHNAAVMAVIFLVVGAIILAKGSGCTRVTT